MIDIQIAHVLLIFRMFGVTEVWSLFESLQSVLFLTDSIFVALFACFNESVDCIEGISHGEVRI